MENEHIEIELPAAMVVGIAKERRCAVFLIICAVIFVLGITFTLSGVGAKTAYKASDADQQWDDISVFHNNACSPINSTSFLDHDE